MMSKAEDRLYVRDSLIYNVTEDLLVILEDQGVSKSELARRLGKSRSYVTQVLSGSRNMTLGSLSDFCFALGIEVKVQLPVGPEPMGEETWNYKTIQIPESRKFHRVQLGDKMIFENVNQEPWSVAS